MRRPSVAAPRRLVGAAALACGLAALACVSTPPEGRGRTIAMSFDGLGGVRLNELLAAGAFPPGGFATIAERGLLAGRAVDVTPSLTPSAHISAITGASPSKTGIVANHFRVPSLPFGQETTGFAAPIEVETLWEAAHRHGLRVGVLLYPGADAANARRRGDFGLTWPDGPAQGSAFLTVPADQWTEATTAPRSFSPPKEARLTVAAPGGAIRLRLTATDTTDDGTANYDLVTFAKEGGASPTALGAVPVHGWFALDVPGDAGRRTAWCRLEGLDPGLQRAEVYIGEFHAIPGYPAEYRAKLEAAIGGWPGPPDFAFLREKRPGGDEAFMTQAIRLADYLTAAILDSIREERWDLLVGYQPLVDEVQHSFEPGSRGGSKEAIVRAFQTADRSAAAVLAALAPRDSYFFFSDHGIVPLEKAVDLERFLEGKGWGIASAKGTSGPPGARRVQVTSTSGIAHVYLDPAFTGEARTAAARDLLADLRTLDAAAPGIVDDVVPHAELSRIDLDNPRSGDVVLLLKPGAEFRRGATVFPKPLNLGGHGYRNVTPVLDASFGAIGPGIAPGRPESVRLVEVAARAARALGIEPPKAAAPAGR